MTGVTIHPGVLNPDDWLGLLLRLVLAMTIGGIIGWNRQKRGKAAGLRTHVLVSLGAAVFVLIPLQTIANPSLDAVSRAIQGVATGVGFLGAGEILHYSRQNDNQMKIKGLTSAASIWVTAGLGMAAGCGLWGLGLMAALLTLLTLTVLKQVEEKASVQPKD